MDTNKLFIIGNGFDLAHHLETSYSDFICWLLKKIVNTTYDSKYLTNGRKYKNSDDYIEVILNQSGINPDTMQDALNRLNNQSKISELFESIPTYYNEKIISFHFLNPFLKKIVTILKDKKWVDIEKAYFDELTEIYYHFDNRTIDFLELEHRAQELNKVFDYLKDNLEKYLQTIDYGKVDVVHDIEINILNELAGNNETHSARVMFLNFNYTSLIKQYAKAIEAKSKSEIVNIHGEIGNKDNPIIFGYGDETTHFYEKLENVNSNHLLNNFKSFAYFRTHNYQKLNSFINDKNYYNVYIFGHSCGLSDRVLLKSIFENTKCTTIKIFYYKDANGKDDYFEKTQEISRHFSIERKAEMRNYKVLDYTMCRQLSSFK